MNAALPFFGSRMRSTANAMSEAGWYTSVYGGGTQVCTLDRGPLTTSSRL